MKIWVMWWLTDNISWSPLGLLTTGFNKNRSVHTYLLHLPQDSLFLKPPFGMNIAHRKTYVQLKLTRLCRPLHLWDWWKAFCILLLTTTALELIQLHAKESPIWSAPWELIWRVPCKIYTVKSIQAGTLKNVGCHNYKSEKTQASTEKQSGYIL